MKLIAPFNFVMVDLTSKEQKEYEELMKLQEGDLEKSIGSRNDSKKIAGIVWKRLKFMEVTGEQTKQIKVPLNEHDQILLKRYIDAER